MVGPLPYVAMQGLGANFYPHGRRGYWKSSYIADLSDAAIDTMIAQFESVPSPFGAMALEEMGGAVSRVGADETAFGDRSAHYSLIITAEWMDAADDERNIRWARDVWEAMRPYESETAYVNYLGADEQDRVRSVYGAEKYERLVALKNTYDPTNMFNLNQNIRPTV